VHRLDKLSDRLGAELWVKRDDLSGDEYGGNRVRQMEWLLADLKRRGAQRIITSGGVGSNYIVAVAAYARRLGIRCDAIMVHQPLTSQVQKNLLLAKHFGAHIHYARTFPGGILVLLKLLATTTMRDRSYPYVVRPGGATPLGSLGYAFGALELAAQIRRGECPLPDRLFVATSSCGTTAGLLAGLSLSGLEIPVTGVRVVEQYIANVPHIRLLTERVLQLMRQYAPHAYADAPPSSAKFELCHDFFGGQYGRPLAAGEEAVAIARDEAGLTLEGTYTGKSFAAVLAWAKRPENHGRRALFWNTYNSTDFTEVLKQADWRELPKRVWQYFDGSIQFAKAAAR
jgi:D-cysteine desulfhydrase